MGQYMKDGVLEYLIGHSSTRSDGRVLSANDNRLNSFYFLCYVGFDKAVPMLSSYFVDQDKLGHSTRLVAYLMPQLR